MESLVSLTQISLFFTVFFKVFGQDDTLMTSYTTSCSKPLGLTSGAIEDWQIAASSNMDRSSDSSCASKYARLHRDGGQAWCAKTKSKHEWLLIDVGVPSVITGIITQGRDTIREWVTSYSIAYSLDASKWEVARDIYGNTKIFTGNRDSHQLKHSYLEHPVTARFIRIQILAWFSHPSLRLEIVGCQKCNELISTSPFTEITASSHKPWSKRKSCLPSLGDLSSNKGWCPKRQNDHQWLQFDLGPPKKITGFITKGQGDRKRFVSSYTISYSNDSFVWFTYKDANHVDSKIFGGNMDKKTERRHYLNSHFVARYVRFHPLKWNKKIGMRAGILGCPHTGECGPGFMQVNSGSPCIPNKAYAMETWVNSESSTNENTWSYGHSSLATDGKLDTNLQNCAYLDNKYVDSPVWAVDLGKMTTINGVVVITWQGLGQDTFIRYTDYTYNLDSLTVYVSKKKKSDNYKIHLESVQCASISRKETALFNPKLHFDCLEPIKGRYVYIKVSGVPNRWRKFFKVILCEIMVY